MSKILWDQTGEKVYHVGVDRGVFYSPNHMIGDGFAARAKGFAWNGLISVEEQKEKLATTPVYFEGVKTYDAVTDGDFSATVKAVTYPDEFLEFDGYSEYVDGISLDSQPRDTFGMAYRTMIGNDVDGSDSAYSIHILYNLTAIPDSVGRQTVDSNIAPVEFSWKMEAVAEYFPNRRPSAHVVIDSRKVRPEALVLLEEYLYGTESVEPRLPRVPDIIAMTCIAIVDNGDGTWTATGPEYLMSVDVDDIFTIDGATIGTPTLGDYKISSTYE